jgi:hypothetical protein
MKWVAEAMVLIAITLACLASCGSPDIIDALRGRIERGTCPTPPQEAPQTK